MSKKFHDPHIGKIHGAFKHAIAILDATEPQIREWIEADLMHVAVQGRRVGETHAAATELAKKVAAHRTAAIKKAFRHLRDNLPNDL